MTMTTNTTPTASHPSTNERVGFPRGVNIEYYVLSCSNWGGGGEVTTSTSRAHISGPQNQWRLCH